METKTMQTTKVGTYLTFVLGDELFAANVTNVVNILEMTKITRVPLAPPFMKGVVNLRGEVLPVVDSRIKFDLGETEFTSNTCILVLEFETDKTRIKVGAIVDGVREVCEFDEKDILDSPSIGQSYRSEFILGVASHNDEFVMILDTDKVFTSSEIQSIKHSIEQ